MPETQYELLTREFLFRAESVDTEKREVIGIAVPFDVETDIAGIYREKFAPGAVQDSDDALLFWRHADPIGKVTSHQDRKEGWEIRAKVSDTTLGKDALTLARDGVVTQLSVGFEPGGEHVVQEREDDIPLVTRTKVKVREVSLVPFGQYGAGASVTEVRERPNPKENKMSDTQTTDAPDLMEVRESIEDLERRFTVLSTQKPEEQVLETRSAAEIVKALASGDESTLTYVNQLQERAYAGGTTADSVLKDAWVGDLTRLFDSSSGVLASLFGTGTLPATGNNIEYGQLKSNSVQFTEQAAEGDDLAYGKVALETKTAPVKTYGGYVQLSFQEIQRSSLPVLQRSLDALTIAAAARMKSELRTSFGEVVTAQAANSVILGSTLAAATYSNFVNAIVDAAVKYNALNLGIDALVVSATVFKKIAGLTGSDGRPMVSLDGTGANTVGRLNVTALNGSLVGIPMILDADQTGDAANFINGRAITVYSSPLVSLQDQNIINLSKDFSAYRYAAFAKEIPGAVIPLKLAAS